ncbi:MAG: hypothetical protein P4L40_22335 [Terracidiphilus sp.]|nr:hypothetical protein [Terracidiphilus sp.]
MTQSDIVELRANLCSLYLGQRELWKAMDAVGQASRRALLHLNEHAAELPQPVRQSMDELCGILMQFRANEHTIQEIEARVRQIGLDHHRQANRTRP